MTKLFSRFRKRQAVIVVEFNSCSIRINESDDSTEVLELPSSSTPIYPPNHLIEIPPIEHDLVETDKRVGEYKLGSLLGKGYFGQVHRASSERLKTPVAIKTLKKGGIESPETWYDFDMEVGVLSRHCHHENIISLHEVMHGPEGIYLVMEKAAMDLATLIKYTNIVKEQPDLFQQVMRGILEAIKYLHDHGISHNDLHPENILIQKSAFDAKGKCRSGCRIEASDIRLCDFGRSTVSKYYDRTNHKTLLAHKAAIARMGREGLGKMLYMAPETISGKLYDTRVADVWSIGVTLMEIRYGGLSNKWKQSFKYFYKCSKSKQFQQEISSCLRRVETSKSKKRQDELLHDFLCSDLLVIDTEKRASAAIALRHPWFKYQYPEPN